MVVKPEEEHISFTNDHELTKWRKGLSYVATYTNTIIWRIECCETLLRDHAVGKNRWEGGVRLLFVIAGCRAQT